MRDEPGDPITQRAMMRIEAEAAMRERCAMACEALDRQFSDRLNAACRTNPTVIAVVAAVATAGGCLARTIRALPLAAASTQVEPGSER